METPYPIKQRKVTAVENGNKVKLFVVEMSDGSRWYTTENGHCAFNTFDKIVSGTRIDNLSDGDMFSYYGNEYDLDGRITTISQFWYLVQMEYPQY